MSIEVIAKSPGYYGNKWREIGERFSIRAKDERGNWRQRAGLTDDEPGEETVVTDEMITAALAQLDHTNHAHWTAEGKPRMDAVEAFVGSDTVTRKDVDRVAPNLVREGK